MASTGHGAMLWVVGMPTNLPRTRKLMSLRAVVHGGKSQAGEKKGAAVAAPLQGDDDRAGRSIQLRRLRQTNRLRPRAIHLLRSDVQRGHNDARWLRERQGEERLLAEVIRQAAWRFRGTGAA